jgi:hypothetical protein
MFIESEGLSLFLGESRFALKESWVLQILLPV